MEGTREECCLMQGHLPCLLFVLFLLYPFFYHNHLCPSFLSPSSSQLLISGFLSWLHQHSQDYRIPPPPPLHTLNSNCQSAVKDTLCFGVNEVELVKITIMKKKVEYGVVFLQHLYSCNHTPIICVKPGGKGPSLSRQRHFISVLCQGASFPCFFVLLTSKSDWMG